MSKIGWNRMLSQSITAVLMLAFIQVVGMVKL